MMPCWYFDKKALRNTPSLQDNIDYETECRYRKEGARFLIDTGTKMDLGNNTMATGVVYFHRFYMYHSFRKFPRYVTACCCLFLAGKVEETPKKCKDIINAAKSFLTDQKFATFGEDPKEEVMTLERILLQTIKFDLQVEHPYHYLLKYAKCLKGDKNKLNKMVQMAWTFVNDSLCTTLCLQWEPEVIAVALMYLAGKLSKFEVVDWSGRNSKHLRWWDMFIEDVTMDLLEDICHQVLDLYSQPQVPAPPDSPPLTRNQTVNKEAPPPLITGSSPPLTLPLGTKQIPKEHKIPVITSNGDHIKTGESLKASGGNPPPSGGPGVEANYPPPAFHPSSATTFAPGSAPPPGGTAPPPPVAAALYSPAFPPPPPSAANTAPAAPPPPYYPPLVPPTRPPHYPPS